MTRQPSLRAYAGPADRDAEPLARRVLLHDVTLREGLEAAAGPVSFDDRLALATALAQAGLDEIQIGYLGRSPEDRRLVDALRDDGVTTALEGIVPLSGEGWPEEVDAALAAAPDRLNLILPLSAARLGELRLSVEAAIERAAAAVAYAARYCAVAFTPVDATRAEPARLVDAARVVEAAGADRFYVIDTAGISSPAGMRALVEHVLERCTMRIAVHCHDDLGLAVANGLAAVEAGAEVVDVCVNGIGKRAGNLALEEIAVALALFLAVDLSLWLDRIGPLAELTARISGIAIPPNKALVGHKAFDTRVDARLNAQRGHRPRPLFDPSIIGRER